MNTIETIRAEIKRINEDIVSNNIDCHPTTVLDDLLSFLDTIEEKPVEGLDEAAEEQARSFGYMSEDYEYKENMESFKAGAEWRDRMLNWARDLVQAGIDKPEEAVNILKRLKELL